MVEGKLSMEGQALCKSNVSLNACYGVDLVWVVNIVIDIGGIEVLGGKVVGICHNVLRDGEACPTKRPELDAVA